MRISTLFLLLMLVTACDRGADTVADSRRGAANAPTLAYARRIFFVGGNESAPSIVVFKHSVLAGPTAVERSAGIWHTATEGKWHPLLDLRWTDEPIRDPWRLIPHGPFRILVDDAGDLEALRGRGDAGEFRLAPLLRLGEWRTDELPRHLIHQAEWSLGKDSIAGLLVDIEPTAADDGSTTSTTELILTDGEEFRLIASLPANAFGDLWLQRGERIEAMNVVTLERDTTPELDAWHLDARRGELRGELQTFGTALELDRGEAGAPGTVTPGTLPAGGEPNAGEAGAGRRAMDGTVLQALRGWIEVRGDRRAVFGVMRRAPT